MRILYVEDDDTLAKSVELMLQSEGHLCDTTAYGKRAVVLARCYEYDVILLDIMLPDIDGYEVMRKVREVGVETPFLVQTGLVDRGDELAAAGFGAAEYLVKPYNKKELIDRLEAVVARAREDELVPADEDGRLGGLPERHDDRRAHRRFKAIRGGQITFRHPADGIKSTNCIIFSLSYGGAALQIDGGPDSVPATFALREQSGKTHQCEVCWRYRDKAGVKFIHSTN